MNDQQLLRWVNRWIEVHPTMECSALSQEGVNSKRVYGKVRFHVIELINPRHFLAYCSWEFDDPTFTNKFMVEKLLRKNCFNLFTDEECKIKIEFYNIPTDNPDFYVQPHRSPPLMSYPNKK